MPTCEYIHFSFPISFSPILSPNLCLDLSSRLVTCHFYLTPRPRFKRSDRTQFPRSIFGLNTLTGLHWSAGQIYSVEFPLCLSLLRDTGSLLCSQLPSGGAAARCFFQATSPSRGNGSRDRDYTSCLGTRRFDFPPRIK